MFRPIHTLALVAGLLGFVGQVFAQDPVTERPNAPAIQSAQYPNPQPQIQTSPYAKSIWIGTEEMNQNGKLGFALNPNAKALMIDAVGEVQGTWTSQGNEIVIRFKNCVYQGTVQNGILAGRGTFTEGQNAGYSWAFRVAAQQVPQNVPQNVVPQNVPQQNNNPKTLVYQGQENLNGYGKLAFRFSAPNTVEMIDARSTIRGTFSVNGNQITIRFNNCVYVGQVQGSRIIGQANYTEGQANNSWTFEVAMAN